jgi:hypothetical protein
VFGLFVVFERTGLADLAEKIASEVAFRICFGPAHKASGDGVSVIHLEASIKLAAGFAASCNQGSSKGDA